MVKMKDKSKNAARNRREKENGNFLFYLDRLIEEINYLVLLFINLT